MAFHESGHAIVAFHYGFGIGDINCHPFDRIDPFILGMRAEPHPHLLEADGTLAQTLKARQLLAGEIAARICLGLPTN
jgi:hypothetical protein